jgi:hypothetical protein
MTLLARPPRRAAPGEFPGMRILVTGLARHGIEPEAELPGGIPVTPSAGHGGMGTSQGELQAAVVAHGKRGRREPLLRMTAAAVIGVLSRKLPTMGIGMTPFTAD